MVKVSLFASRDSTRRSGMQYSVRLMENARYVLTILLVEDTAGGGSRGLEGVWVAVVRIVTVCFLIVLR